MADATEGETLVEEDQFDTFVWGMTIEPDTLDPKKPRPVYPVRSKNLSAQHWFVLMKALCTSLI